MSAVAPGAGSAAESAIPERRHYAFRTARLEPTVAHGGIGRILTRRVEGPDPARAARFVDLTVLPPGTSIGLHRHGPDNEEIYVVVSGRGRMILGEEEFEVGPGDVIINDPLGQHGLTNVGDEPIQLVVVEIPLRAREEATC